MEFAQWFEAFGDFNYTLPKDKEQQLYDFYMLSMLPRNNVYHGERGHEDVINYELGQVAKTLIPSLKKNLLDAVFFSLCAEIRHVVDRNNQKELIHKVRDQLGRDWSEMLRKYLVTLPQFTSDSTTGLNRGHRPEVRNKELTSNTRGYKGSFYAALKSIDGDREKFVRLMEWLFGNTEWRSGYGGAAWVNIAKAWLKLSHASNESDATVWIDHVYDLQHNTDTVFNKLDSFKKNDSYAWIAKALNHKRDFKDDMHELIDKVSPKMKRLALRAIKDKSGVAYQSYLNKQDDVGKNSPLAQAAQQALKGGKVTIAPDVTFADESEETAIVNAQIGSLLGHSGLFAKYPPRQAKDLQEAFNKLSGDVYTRIAKLMRYLTKTYNEKSDEIANKLGLSNHPDTLERIAHSYDKIVTISTWLESNLWKISKSWDEALKGFSHVTKDFSTPPEIEILINSGEMEFFKALPPIKDMGSHKIAAIKKVRQWHMFSLGAAKAFFEVVYLSAKGYFDKAVSDKGTFGDFNKSSAVAAEKSLGMFDSFSYPERHNLKTVFEKIKGSPTQRIARFMRWYISANTGWTFDSLAKKLNLTDNLSPTKHFYNSSQFSVNWLVTHAEQVREIFQNSLIYHKPTRLKLPTEVLQLMTVDVIDLVQTTSVQDVNKKVLAIKQIKEQFAFNGISESRCLLEIVYLYINNLLVGKQ